MVRNFVVSAEIVAWPFVVSAEIVASMVQVGKAKRLVQEEDDELIRLLRQSWQPYNQALEVWCRSEHLVTRNLRLVASACHDTADSASETAHHIRKSLSRVDDNRIEMSELLEV